MSYWLIKTLLIIGLLIVAWALMRPVKSANHLALRRLSVMVIVILAGLSVIFPDVVNRVAWAIGVNSGVNLLVYVLFLAVFTQMATGYRRDLATERKITALARAIALESAPKPPSSPSVSDSSPAIAPPKDDGSN